jgi:tellurite resistance protein TehA-like permease
MEKKPGLAMKLFLLPTRIYIWESPYNFIIGTLIWLCLIGFIAWGLSIVLQPMLDPNDYKNILLSIFTGFAAILGLGTAALSFRWDYLKQDKSQDWKFDDIKRGATFTFIAIGITISTSLCSDIFLPKDTVAFIFTLLWAFFALISLGLLIYKSFGLGFGQKATKDKTKVNDTKRYIKSIKNKIIGTNKILGNFEEIKC